MDKRSPCEICGARGVTALELEQRRVLLCRAHAAEALSAELRSIDELRRLFVEPNGRRTLLARRARDERRVFPPRPEGRRCADGRRHNDA